MPSAARMFLFVVASRHKSGPEISRKQQRNEGNQILRISRNRLMIDLQATIVVNHEIPNLALSYANDSTRPDHRGLINC
jgi:hypothetical protein